jgi:hypothetical protein
MRVLSRFDERWIALAIAIVVLFLGVRYGTRVAGGADSYGYVSQADAWARGAVEIKQHWADRVPWPVVDRTFTPLGYRPSQDRRGIVPTYPPGLPLLMAGAAKVAGYCAMFWVVPISGAVLVMGTCLLGRRLGSPKAGLAAAALVASSPIFLFMVPQPMSDVPVSAAWVVSFLLLIGTTRVSAASSGLAAGLAMLIRPNLAPLAIIPIAWLGVEAWRGDRDGWQRQRARLLWFLLGFSVCVVFLAIFNWTLYGSPLRSGYGDVSILFSWEHLWPNITHYARWFADYQTLLPFVGLAAIVLPMPALWRRAADRRVVLFLAAFVLIVWLQYCAYQVFDGWWYLRFLLPCWPFIMIGFAQIVWRIGQTSRWAAAAATLLVIALVARGAWLGVKEGSFELWQGESRYVTTTQLVAKMTEPNAVVFSSQMTGAVRYYGGRVTVAFNWMEPDWLDRAVAFLAEHGVHAYALLDDWEMQLFKDHFPGQKTLARFDEPPVLTYITAGETRLIDLLPAARPHTPLEVREVPLRQPQCVPPAPRPVLVLK